MVYVVLSQPEVHISSLNLVQTGICNLLSCDWSIKDVSSSHAVYIIAAGIAASLPSHSVSYLYRR